MFFNPKKSIPEEIKEQDTELHNILQFLSKLQQFTQEKYNYLIKMLNNMSGQNLYFTLQKSKDFLERNLHVLNKLKEYKQLEKNIEKEELRHKLLFKHELITLYDALNKLDELQDLLEQEKKLLKFIEDRDNSINSILDSNRILVLLSKCLEKEIILLKGEYKDVIKFDRQLMILNERVTKYKKLPILKSKYYHASSFLFNKGDVIKPSKLRPDPYTGEIAEIESYIEKVRQQEFPENASRENAVFVFKDPFLASEHGGIVYAVEVSGKVSDGDYEAFTEYR
ncbi:MAG: hypothetical protein AB7V77_00235 [Candidatus Woesearchaeota archaeon]